jgi:hypothetical protein
VLPDLALTLAQCIRESQPVLLGSRDPSSPSCVKVMKTGSIGDSVPPLPVDVDGGPGSAIGGLIFIDRSTISTATVDFLWHQTRLRRFLENRQDANDRALQFAAELAARTRELAQAVDRWNSVPAHLSAASVRDERSWPMYCFSNLDRAITSRDLAGAKRWSKELAAAAFALEDLHRWYAFLIANHLTALDFQQRCETVFASTQVAQPVYEPMRSISQLPAGVLGLNGIGNYYEVERQAEFLLGPPPEFLASAGFVEPEAVWLAPHVRPVFIKAGSVLSSANRRTWARAAQTPYERSYLVSMLHRAADGDAVDQMCAALQRFDQTHPDATISELMGSIAYRGHSFAGLEWADRYQPELMSLNATGSPADLFLAAGRWTSNFNHRRDAYGMTFTLREALLRRKLDCIRATDMIGAIFRNSGNTRFGFVFWTAEDCAHSVAAYLGEQEGKPHTLIVDGLEDDAKLEVWPNAYFNGHRWPPGFDRNPTPYAAELYARGIDSYVWAEGYIIRGPHAGTLGRAKIPYSRTRTTTDFRQIFDGPYPR